MYDYIHTKYMRNNNCENSCYLYGDDYHACMQKRFYIAFTTWRDTCVKDGTMQSRVMGAFVQAIW